jgi:hypothetical protein
MTSSAPKPTKIKIEPFQYRDLDEIESLIKLQGEEESSRSSLNLGKKLGTIRNWYGLLKFFSFFPNPHQDDLRIYVAEIFQKFLGFIQISPSNSTRTTWRIGKIALKTNPEQTLSGTSNLEIGSQLLRYCFETIWEARTWIVEVNIHEKQNLALYRHNGFQPLAQITYWAISLELLAQIAQNEPDLPNLIPKSNADAQLLYQLDCVSMPPLLRQVFDRHTQDFKTNLITGAIAKIENWFGKSETIGYYVFETQRKAAIGAFELKICLDGSKPHQAQLNIHPAYTWLYPQVFAQMAQILAAFPPQTLELVSADYQPEREEYLEKLGAVRVEHTLLMSRSVWHKLREAKPLEALQLSDMLQGLKPARTPIPSRITWLNSMSKNNKGMSDLPEMLNVKSKEEKEKIEDSTEEKGGNHNHA